MAVKHLFLAILSKQAMHGYDIKHLWELVSEHGPYRPGVYDPHAYERMAWSLVRSRQDRGRQKSITWQARDGINLYVVETGARLVRVQWWTFIPAGTLELIDRDNGYVLIRESGLLLKWLRTGTKKDNNVKFINKVDIERNIWKRRQILKWWISSVRTGWKFNRSAGQAGYSCAQMTFSLIKVSLNIHR